MDASMIGLDIAKTIFQVQGEDATGRVVLRRRLRREAVERYFATLPPAVVGLEACGSAHHWGRVLRAMGHEVRLLPAAYVKPFVRRNKTDARDAAAICHAMRQPDLHPVPLKTVQQSCARGLERAHDLLVRQRTQLANAIRGLLAELGIVAAQGLRGFATLCDKIDIGGAAIPELLRPALRAMLAQGQAAGEHVAALQAQIMARARADATMRRLMQVPGIGPLTAHAIVAAIGDGRQCGAARDFAAWAGLTPHQHESGGKRRSGRISRQGDNGVRRLLVLGASAVMRQVRAKPRRGTAWIHGILARRPVKVAVVAQAAKTARIAWAMLRSGEPYRAPAAV